MTALLLGSGLIFLLIGSEALVRGSVHLAQRFGVSQLFVGMVIVGFGTSMPELMVSVRAVLSGSPGLAAGNVIGSNLSNILLILAVAALIRPISRPTSFFISDAAILLGVSIAVIVSGLQGALPSWQGGVMVALLIVLMTLRYRRDGRATLKKAALAPPIVLPEEVPRRLGTSLLMIAAGFGGLLYGAELLVDGATRTAHYFGVSEGLIGLTIVAVGTSFPELAVSITASRRGQSDLAYGNVMGSNLFNLLGILGCAAIVGPLTISPILVRVDGVVMIAATVIMFLFIWTRAGVSRIEGGILLFSYILYVALRYFYALS